MEELLSKRIVLVTGKGGVGRSTVTAALATYAAHAGKRVLITEVGEEGNDYSALARLFGRDRLPTERAQIAPGVTGGVLLPHCGHEEFLSSVLRSESLARAALHSEALRRLLDVAPSFREMGIFYHLLTALRERRTDGAYAYDFVVIDMPATGHTLALTGLPQLLLRLISKGPIAKALREGQEYLNDPKNAAAFVVTLPEQLPVSEALELIEGLKKTQMPVGGVILNRMPEDRFTASERALIGRMIEGKRVFGAAGFMRFEESRRSLERLKSRIQVPLLTLPEAPLNHASLIHFLAEAMASTTGPRSVSA